MRSSIAIAIVGCGCLLSLAACSKRATPAPIEPSVSPEAALAAALGPKPTLLGPLASVAQRTPIGDARKRAPLFFDAKEDDARDVTVPELPGLAFSVSVRCTTARGCHVGDWLILLPKESAVAALTSAWGKPAEISGHDGERVLLWWNATDRLRARLETREREGARTAVHLSRYSPVAELLGDGPTLGIEAGRALFGRDVGEVIKEHPEWRSGFSEVTQLDLPPTEWDDGDATVELRTDDRNRIVAFSISIGYGDDRSRDALSATFAQRFGKPRPEGDALLFRPPGRKVVARDDTHSRAWELTLSPRR